MSGTAADAQSALKQLTRQALQQKIKDGDLHGEPMEYMRRLERELKVFAGSGYADVILIIADYIAWARDNDIVVGPGRGSAAGSLVVFLAGITTIDPIQFGLIFERFLNPERVSLPDIDTDFSARDPVIDYVRERYGQNRVAKVGVPSLFKPRSAIDEMAKAFDLDYKENKRITKLIGDAKTFDEAFKAEPALEGIESEHPELFALARAAQGYVRQVSTHPSAVILARGPIGAEIPMQKPPGADKTGRLATGWDGDELDSLGYVKLDILTVDNLSIINRTIASIADRHSVQLDFNDLPLQDRKALDGFTAGETVAVFQLEEAKSVGILKQLPDITFEEVCAVNALIRPGLDVSKFLIARNTGEVSYVIPEMEPILSETNGVILYQEQVMRMCVDLAGFSMADADKFRKIIAKTANQATDFSNEDRQRFEQGYLANGLNPDRFEEIWQMILACQTYVFNKSHAVCYGYIAYADMFLKRHYPLEFMCAALQTRSKELYIKECERLGIEILPPCCNNSQVDYSIEEHEGKPAIRMGLSCIKNIGAKAKQIVDRRPYENEFDLIEKCRLTSKHVESLAYAGALDCYGDRVGMIKYVVNQDQYKEVTIVDLSNGELEMLGFYLTQNPLQHHRDKLGPCVTPMSGHRVRDVLVGGMVSRVYEHVCKNGATMAFVQLLTLDGEMDVMFWPDDWLAEKKRVKVGNIIIGNGRLQDKGTYSVRECEVLNK